MREINNAILKMAKRAETYDRDHLVHTFVDVGPLFTLLSNPDNQILFGRRGTGKTHVLAYLASEIAAKGIIPVQIDMRTIGSSGGIYSDRRLAISERATRLLVDTLCEIHDQVLAEVVEHAEEYDLGRLGPLLDDFIEAATEVIVHGQIQVEDASRETNKSTNQVNVDVEANPGSLAAQLSAGVGQSQENTVNRRVTREGEEALRVHFGAVGNQLQKVVKALPGAQLWIVLDEWSEVPLDLQPYLADLLRRTVLPIRGVSVKIAAIEQRCHFRIPDRELGYIGIEVGADAAASINLDEFLVFDNDKTAAKSFFRDLLYKHVVAILRESGSEAVPYRPSIFINDTFTKQSAFEEFVRSAEGVPRDAINLIGIAAQKAVNNQISVPDVRSAARTWYTRAKQKAVGSKEGAQELLNWIIDKVIQHRQAKAFLLPSDIEDELIDYLFDSRVLHMLKSGVSAQDVPGKRFNVYSLDYGCYVDLVNTVNAPKGLFQADTDDGEQYVEVPQTDFRSIRRAILNIGEFYASMAEA